jgi:iduronate 2-sulfatase
MGYALRTDRYRLVVWRDRRDPTSDPVFVELYDHRNDPKETVNIAAANLAVVESLSARLQEQLSAATPGHP